MKKYILFIPFLFFANTIFAQITPFIECPNINLRFYRSGLHSDPFLGTVMAAFNPNSGKYDSIITYRFGNGCNSRYSLDLNAIGLNTEDGFLYGLRYGNATLNYLTITTDPKNYNVEFYRAGKNGKVEPLGDINHPPLVSGENLSTINTTAGDIDFSDNYFFIAKTGFAQHVDSPTLTKRILLGKVSGLTKIPISPCNSANITNPYYIEITNPSNDASEIFNMLKETRDGNLNTSIVDLAYNSHDGTLYTYLVYQGVGNWLKGQMVKIDTASGVLTAVTPATIIIPPNKVKSIGANYNNFAKGLTFDSQGDFYLEFIDQGIYKAVKSGGSFTGDLVHIHSTPNLISAYHGNMASCVIALRAVPVKISSFTVTPKNNAAYIKWVTTSEINTSTFSIEKSDDAANWIKIADINASGNSGSTKEYHYIDNVASSNVTYYRIVSTDISGEKNYSSIRKVNPVNINPISIFPNPVKNFIIIKSEKQFQPTTQVVITDAIGKQLIKSNLLQESNSIRINTSDLKAGVYLIRIISSDETITRKFVKE